MTFQNSQELLFLVVSLYMNNIVWSVFSETGIILIPFIAVFWNDWIEVYESRGLDGMDISMRKIPFNVIVKTTVLLFFYMPVLEKDFSDFQVVEANLSSFVENSSEGEDKKQVVRDRIERKVEAVFDSGLKTPVMTEIIFNLGRGLVYEIIGRVARSPDIRDLESLIFMAGIKDPTVFEQVKRFTSECYVPARNRFYELYADNPTTAMQSILNDTPNDLAWMGSKILVSTQSLYAECKDITLCNRQEFKARSPVDGFAYDPIRDAVGNSPDTQFAFPTCGEWWLDDEDGVRELLIDYMIDIEIENDVMGQGQVNWYDQMKLVIGATGLVGRELEDNILRHFLRNSHGKRSIPLAYKNLDVSDDLLNAVMSTFGAFGTGKELINQQTYIHIIKIGLPMIQTLMTFGLFLVLPFFGVLSGYDFKKAFIPLVTISLVSFYSYLWFVVEIADNHLLSIMGMDRVWSTTFGISSFGELDSAIKMQLWNLAVGALYVGLPIMFAIVLKQATSYAGGMGDMANAGATKAGAASVDQSAESSSSAASSAASGAVSKGYNAGKGGEINI
jgi:hypothetical protein